VKKVFENDIVSLVKIQIYLNSIFLENKKWKILEKKTRTNSEQIREEFFKKLQCFIG
jgi:hypothetical protein